MNRANYYNPKNVPAKRRRAEKMRGSSSRKAFSIILKDAGNIGPNTKKRFEKLITAFNKGEGKGTFELAKGYFKHLKSPWDPKLGPYADYSVASALQIYFRHLKGFAEKRNADKRIIQFIDGIIKKLSNCPVPP